jgi:thiol-disulfide isomerase/thioredoxin
MRWLTTLTAVVALLALAGCGEQGSHQGNGPDLIGTGKSADYDFTATTLDGQSFDGHSLEGKPAVVWFWAPWCPTCRAQSGTVSQLAEQYDGQVAVVGVGGLDSQAAIEDFAAQVPGVIQLVDDEGAVWRHFRVTAQSTYTVIDADGEILTEGYLDDDQLVDLVEQMAG